MQKSGVLAALFLVILSLAGVGSLLVPNQARAATFTNATIAPNRAQAGVAPGKILVMAQSAQNATENGLKVTVGSAWSISGTASNFTVSTAGLPSGITAWPGIGTATNVAGQSIAFPSGP